MKNWFNGLSKRGKTIAIVLASIFSISAVSAATNPEPNTSNTQNTVQSQAVKAEKKPVVTKRQEVQTTSVAFTESTSDDSSLEQGQARVSEGQNGEKQITYEVTYENGREVSRKEVSSAVTKQPINKVTYNGTKAPAPSCPNGTYINTAGNTVCSPYVSSSAPAGATAQCSDGTYSFSQSRSGTCSHHGGVATWL